MFMMKVLSFILIIHHSAGFGVRFEDYDPKISDSDRRIKFKERLPEQEIRKLAKSLIPPKSRKKIRLQVGIIGGSLEHPIAAYFAGETGFKCGANLPYVFCYKDATHAVTISSQNILVHPIPDEKNGESVIIAKLDLIHSLIIGSGLTPSKRMFNVVRSVIKYIIKYPIMLARISLIFDRDGIEFLKKNIKFLKKYPGSIYISVDRAELIHLWEAHFNGTGDLYTEDHSKWKQLIKKINRNAVLIIEDDILDVIVTIKGAYNASIPTRKWNPWPGQGDVLSGVLALHAYYAYLNKEKIRRLGIRREVLAAYSASSVTRKSGEYIVAKNGRFIITIELYKYIKKANDNFFDSDS